MEEFVSSGVEKKKKEKKRKKNISYAESFKRIRKKKI